MRAIRFATFGGPDVLHFEDVTLPSPQPGQMRVRHTVVGVNFIDTYQRSGLYPVPLPSGLGLEAAGTIEALGDGVAGWNIGDRVAYCSGPIGAYAEANNVAADRVVKLPAGVSDEMAAASLLKGLTAQYLLKRTYKVNPGDTILFHAIAGGVGLIACQWAKHLGATIIGTVGSDEKTALAKAHGCDHVLNIRREDWVGKLRELTGGQGVPVVYDSIGKDTFAGSLDCLGVRGLMVSFGNASGAVQPFDIGLLNAKGSLYLTRPGLFHYTRNAQELQETADDLFAIVASGAVKIAVHQRFPLAQARQAHEALHSRATVGATVLIP